MKTNITILLLSLIWISCKSDKTIIDGRFFYLNFESVNLCELSESKKLEYLDSLQVWKAAVKLKKVWYWKTFDLNQMQFIEDNNLVFAPCIIIQDDYGEHSKRVYFNKADFKKISEKKDIIDQLEPYQTPRLQLEVKEIYNNTFRCEKIIAVYGKKIPEEALDYEEDIEINITPTYTATDVEEIYIKSNFGKNLVNIDSVFPFLETQFQEMEKGNRPIEFPVYDNQPKLKITEKELEDFMDVLKLEYEKIKTQILK